MPRRKEYFLKKLIEFICGNFGILEEALQNFRVEDFARMNWHCHALTGCIFENGMTAALSRQRKSPPFKNAGDLSGGNARKPTAMRGFR